MAAPERAWYTYSTRFAAVANGDVPTQPIQIQANSDFICTHTSAYVAMAAGNSIGIPVLAHAGALVGLSWKSWPFRVLIIDGGSQLQLMNEEVPLASMFGDASQSQKFELPVPVTWQRNSTISIQLRRFATGQLDAAGAALSVTMDVHCVFEGYRVFRGVQNLTA